jgi:hypothetical protein
VRRLIFDCAGPTEHCSDGTPRVVAKSSTFERSIGAIDLCVVPTLTFDRLFAFLVLGHGRTISVSWILKSLFKKSLPLII